MPQIQAYCARKAGHAGEVHHPGIRCAGRCGRLVSIYSSSTGYCNACRKSKTCARCGAALYMHNKTDLCKTCKIRVAERIRRLGLNQIKLAAGCADCGFRSHPDALVFSHVRGESQKAVSLLYNCAWQRVLDEIAKCDVACANCHAIRNTRRLREKFSGHQHARGSTGYLVRRAAVSQVKLAAGCTDCGYRAHAEALQFDHVNGEKVSGIGRMTGAAREDLADEMTKCVVRCANCHAIRTAEAAGWHRSAASGWEGVSDATRSWALGKAREVGVVDEWAIAAAVVSALGLGGGA
jgi:hypothetical protein